MTAIGTVLKPGCTMTLQYPPLAGLNQGRVKPTQARPFEPEPAVCIYAVWGSDSWHCVADCKANHLLNYSGMWSKGWRDEWWSRAVFWQISNLSPSLSLSLSFTLSLLILIQKSHIWSVMSYHTDPPRCERERAWFCMPPFLAVHLPRPSLHLTGC